MNTAQKIQISFNKAAMSYDNHCQVQMRAAKQLIQSLISLCPEAHSLLDLGCGTGITTEQLAKQYAYTDFHAIDIAAALLHRARERLTTYNIHVHEMNFDQLQLTKPFDIIFSNMALHWSENLANLFAAIRGIMQHTSYFAFSIPLSGTLHELHTAYSLNAFPSFTQMIQLLEKNKFDLLMQHKEKIIQPFASSIEALRSLKHIGANLVLRKNDFCGLRTKAYVETHRFEQLTYDIGYFIVKKQVNHA